MPSFEQHLAFLASDPYAAWYVIWNYAGPIGSIYLTRQDEIGLFLSKPWKGLGIGAEALRRLQALHPRGRYLANIAPTNPGSAEFFMKQGFRMIQHTYELRSK